MHEAFECVASLGGLCQVSYQIEQRFGFRINSPFGWIVTPLAAITGIFADDGARFATGIRVMFDGQTAVCAHHGVAYHHDYPRDGKHRITVSQPMMAESRSKMLCKYRRFGELMASRPRTLFIRMAGHHESAYPSPYGADETPLTDADLNGLCAEIEGKLPGLQFAVAMVFLKDFTSVAVDEVRLDARVRRFNSRT